VKTLAREPDKVEILRRLETVRSDSARRWGRMSAHQMVCHLADAFRVAIGELAVSRAVTLGWRAAKWPALYAPLPWPPGIPTRPELDQTRGGSRPGDFGADVARLVALVDVVTRPSTDLEGNEHPLFGRMSRAAWLRWGYLHMDHHLRQFGA
jgi:hypothetical protein